MEIIVSEVDAKIEGITFNAPELVPDPPSNLGMIEGQEFSYSLGDVYDADGDEVEVQVDSKAGFI